MKVLDVFSGIGGFSLGLERSGMETIAFCEFDSHAQKVLKKHWPKIHIHDDVRSLDGKQYRGSVDVVCGGFPCQDLSSAGNQKGFDGDRSSLYVEMLRVIGECMPRYAIFENVSGLVTGDNGRWFAGFLYDLAEIGYDAEWHCISAAYVGAVHHRDRIWAIAYPNVQRQGDDRRRGTNKNELRNSEEGKQKRNSRTGAVIGSSGSGIPTDASSIDDGPHNRIKARRQEQELRESTRGNKIPSNSKSKHEPRFAKIAYYLKQQVELRRGSEAFRDGFNLTEPALRGTDDGVSRRMDRLRLARLGNAVVPQIPELIGRAIIEYELAKEVK